MYAIIKTGGKQYRVQKNDEIYVELLDAKVGETVVFDEVLMHGDTIGTPLVKGVQVSGTVVKHGKQKKITIFKFKAKKDFRNKKGHRQNYTLVKIEEIGKNKEIRNRYDYSGNQLFIYNSELSKYDYTNCYKELNIQISKFDINIDELIKLKCKYILSAVKINNYNYKIKFLKVFNDKISCYRIFLYEII